MTLVSTQFWNSRTLSSASPFCARQRIICGEIVDMQSNELNIRRSTASISLRVAPFFGNSPSSIAASTSMSWTWSQDAAPVILAAIPAIGAESNDGATANTMSGRHRTALHRRGIAADNRKEAW
jgi:hypothetical protein